MLSDIIQMTLYPKPGVSRLTRLCSALAMLAMAGILGFVSWWLVIGSFFAGEAVTEQSSRASRHTLWEASTWLGIGGVCGALFAVVLVVIGLLMVARLFGPNPEPEKLADVRYNE